MEETTACTTNMTGGDPREGMPGLTVAAGVARALVEYAATRGASREALMRRAGIDAEDLLRQDDRLPVGTYLELLDAARELCDDSAFALHFGAAIDLSDMSIVGLLGSDAGTIEDGLGQMSRYASLLIETGGRDEDRLATEHRSGDVWVIDRRPADDSPLLTEATLARMAGGARRFFGDNRLLKAVHVTHPAPEYRDAYDRVFQVPVVFESRANALVFDATWWGREIPTGSPYVARILDAHADRLLHELEQSKTTRGRVEQILIPRLRAGETRMERIATDLGMSRQTLLRRLKSEGVTFSEVLDELRQAVALRCLREGGLSVKETAYRVGYSEPAAFSRAFKRWTGLSPRAFLAREREEDDS